MPMHHHFSKRAMATLPAGAYAHNFFTGNQYFISKISEFTFADMPENFFKNPIQLEDRNEHLSIAQHMLWELHQAVIHKGMNAAKDKPLLKLPEQLTLAHIRHEKSHHERKVKKLMSGNKQYAWINNEGISCAWEAPDDYFLYDDASLATMETSKARTLKVKALDEGISFLYDAGVNLVWFEFNAEAYLSEHARFKQDRERFINQVNAIAAQLRQTARRLGKSLPKVFIGTDITTNFATHPVLNQAQDIFGHTYSKIPAPLDLVSFWKPEVIEPFDLFCKTFGAQLPITGIFLDFEMYHALEQATAYSDHMDFSHNTWQHCCQNLGDGSSCGLSSVCQRVDYLMHNKLFTHYFIDLENQAAQVGLALKEHLRAIMPDLLIAVYLPTLPTSWFYRGILRGLSSEHEPLITATFNTDFYSHAQWLRDHNIHLIHGTPLLLSKIAQEEDFNLIPKFLQYHDFVWYNRPSRMVYRNKTGKWWSTEASCLDAHSLANGIKKNGSAKMKLSLLFLSVFLMSCNITQPDDISAVAYNKIGNLIWRNESGNSVEKLTWWNDGEEFASLGIGHCIWYPKHEKINFVQVFPGLLNFLHSNGVAIPTWLGVPPNFIPCPWQTREQFFAEFESEKMRELRSLLSKTIDLQTHYIINRTHTKLNHIIAQAQGKNKKRFQALITELEKTSNGLYALSDYINFKGDGIDTAERYNNQGWGLTQVLAYMKEASIAEFVRSAKQVLTERVKNSPQARNEQKFLPGWINRVNTYTAIF